MAVVVNNTGFEKVSHVYEIDLLKTFKKPWYENA